MKKKIVSVLMLTLILTSTLGMAFSIRPSFAEDGENSILSKDFVEKKNEATLPNEITKPYAEQEKTLESSRQTSRNSEDEWNFNDTNEWTKFAYLDGNKTRLIVGIDGDNPANLPELERIAAKYHAEIVGNVFIGGQVRAEVVELLLGSVAAFVADVNVERLANYVEPNMKVQAQLVPNDPYWDLQWGPQRIEADYAWNTTVGDSSVLVAVVDTGIDYTHPDLVANYAPLGYDWVNTDPDPLDDFGHGTHCAGIIAAVLNNSVGIAGLAQVRVMAEKVLDSLGGGYDDWVANGIVHAADQGAKIISMSLGGYGESNLIHDAVQYAYGKGVLLVAAAGNDNTNMKSYPAAYDEVIAVAATDQYDSKAGFSNWGDWIELAAPGVNIYSTMPTYHVTLNDYGYAMNYDYLSGTSMACPHVSGAAALLWSQYPNKTRDWLRLWLRYTAEDLGEPGFDEYYGHGRINVRKALEQSPPAHELIAYEWGTPPYVKPGTSGIINATVLNFGENNETQVNVQLLANNTVMTSTLIGFIASGNSATVSLTWNPTAEGSYNVTLYVVPVLGEIGLENNVLWKYIYVGFLVKAVVLHSAGNVDSATITNWQVLNSEWRLFGGTAVYVDYATLNKDDITYSDIASTEADVLIISCAFDPYAGWQFTDSEVEAITRYVREGHGLIVTAGTLYNQVPNNNKLAPLFGLNETTMWGGTGTDLLHLLNTTHPIFASVPNPLTFPQVGTALPYDGRWDSNELVDGKYLALGHYEESAVVAYRGLVYISPWLEIIPPYYHHHLQLLYNAITWSRYQKPEHELVVSLEAPRSLQPGESTLINATVSNEGLNNETNVELYFSIDGTVVDSTTLAELPVGASHRIGYLWAPSVEKMYNLTAYAPPVPGEEFAFNNNDSAMIFVRFVRFVLWDDTRDTDGDSLTGNYLYLYQLLTASGFVIDELTIGPITGELLANYDILVLMDPELDFSASEIADIQNWVESGGALVSVPDGGYPPTINTLMSPYGVQMTGGVSWYGTTTNVVSHPITRGVGSIYVDGAREISATSPSTILAWTADSYAFLSATETGEVVVISDSNIMDNERLGNDDNTQLMLNVFNWVGIKPEHDLSVSLDAPKLIKPSQSALLNATVSNKGLSNESDVELRILVDGAVVQSTTIYELLAGDFYTLTYLFIPTAEGIYNVTAYALPVPSEDNIQNNVKSERVTVSTLLVALFQNWRPWDYPSNEEALDRYGIPYVVFSSSDFGRVDLGMFMKVVIASDQDQTFYNAMDAYRWWFEDFVRNGGLLEIHAADWGSHSGGWVGPLPGGLQWTQYYGQYVTIVDPTHSVLTVPNTITEAELDNWNYAVHGYFSVYPADAHIIVIEDLTSMPAYLEFTYGSGSIIASSQTLEWAYEHRFSLMLENSLLYMPMRHEHDLAVSAVVPTSLEWRISTVLIATVQNRGLNNETDVELYLLVNDTVVSSAAIAELRVGELYTITCAWTPMEIGSYNITAYAPPVPQEEDAANNVMAKEVKVFFYTRLYLPHDWIGGGDPMGWHGDDSSWQYDLPFDFPFYGVYYKTIYISSNGLITFLAPDSSYSNSIFALAQKLAIAPAWDDWVTSDQYDIYVWQNSTHVGIRWYVRAYGSSFVANFEAVLGADGVIQFNYEYNDGPITATIGISNGALHILAEDVASIDRIGTVLFTPFPVEHDLTVTLEASTPLELGNSMLLNATVRNNGINNETSVELYLLIDGTVVTSATNLALLAGESTTANYLWTPNETGNYNITVYAPPVSDEERTADNIAMFSVSVFTYSDVAVADVAVSPNVFYQGWIVKVNVTVANLGRTTENFTVTLYYDSTAIATKPVDNLPPNATSMLSFAWNTTSVPYCHYYVIKCVASTVPGEANTSNNVFIDGSVKVKMLGDVNGDGYVNIKDATLVGLAFGCELGDPNWNPQTDLNQDGYINIKDVVLLGSNFGLGSPKGCLVQVETPSQVSGNTVFNVAIIAENIPSQAGGMAGWELILSWTPGTINCIGETINLDYWPFNSGPLMADPIDNENGHYHQSLTLRNPSMPVTGSYWLVNLTFQSVAAPTPLATDLIIEPAPGLTFCLVDGIAVEIPHDFVYGRVTVTPSILIAASVAGATADVPSDILDSRDNSMCAAVNTSPQRVMRKQSLIL